jgi:chromosome partitioning protein
MSQVIAFINFKGGVGKTANAVHVGTCLAADHNKRVLIVDLDPQCNATFWLLPPKEWRSRIDDMTRTVCQIFHDQINGTKKFSFSNSVIRGVPISETGVGLNPKIDLLPASVELIEVEDILHEQNKKPFFTFLRTALAPLRQEYDYILLDCPPNVFTVTKNALYFADSYVVPYIPDYLSLSGLTVFARRLRMFQESVAKNDPRMREPRIRAIIVNRFKSVGKMNYSHRDPRDKRSSTAGATTPNAMLTDLGGGAFLHHSPCQPIGLASEARSTNHFSPHTYRGFVLRKSSG